MQIIGVVGFIGSGKGTVGDILVHNYDFVADSFAASLKDAVAIIFGWPRHLLEGDTEESRKFRETVDAFWSEKLGREFTPRLALQLMGTEAGRDIFGQNIWTGSLERRIKSRGKNTVITDVRFPNEIELIHNMGGIVLWVTRGDRPDWYDNALAYNKGLPLENLEEIKPNVHYSEWAWIGEKIDILLSNDGTFEDLKMNVASVINHLTNTRY